MRHEFKIIIKMFFGLAITVFFCAFLIYYIVAMQCHWATFEDVLSERILRVLVFSDTHMLGPKERPRNTEWRKEWQMHQAFQAIVTVHNPDLIFGLGDLINEGAVSNDLEFKREVDRFFSLFPNTTKMYVVAGAQDVGYHYWLKPGAVERFHKEMSSTDVQHLFVKECHIILLNSIALYGDSCNMCVSARKKIDEIADKFNQYCKNFTEYEENSNCSRPIIMQHFPLYRESDEACSGPDIAPFADRFIPYVPNVNTLSKEATNYLVTTLKPRAVFGAHNHYGCFINHSFVKGNDTIDFLEVTVSAFNWRYRRDPKYLLVSLTPTEMAAQVCNLPTDLTIIYSGFILIVLTVLVATFDDVKSYLVEGFKKKT